MRCAALTVLGRIAVRRGQPEATALLGSAWDLAARLDEMQRVGPAAKEGWDWVAGVHARQVQQLAQRSERDGNPG